MSDEPWVPKVGEKVVWSCVVKSELADGVFTVSDPETRNEARHAVAILGELRPADQPIVDEMCQAIGPTQGDPIELWQSESGEWFLTTRFGLGIHTGSTPTAAIAAAYDALKGADDA